MLVPIRFMLDQARANDYGFLRVVVSNLEETEAALRAAEKTHSPIALAVNTPEMEFPRYRTFESMVLGGASKSQLPVGVQFDHTDDMNLILQAVRGGYNGIMIDASHHPLEENIARTKKIVEICHPLGISVEGEVGIIKRTWDEDFKKEVEAGQMTDPDLAAEYVAKTKVDALAISIGENSGFDSGDLDFDILKAIREKVDYDTHLCLHGVSFIHDQDIENCIAGGINYFGCASEFLYAFFLKLDEVRKEHGPKMVDTKRIYGPAREAMKESIVKKIKLLRSDNQAAKVISTYYSEIQK